MTVVCCVCGLEIKEKCRGCGSSDLLFLFQDSRQPLYFCRGQIPRVIMGFGVDTTVLCGRLFPKGDGGVSNSYCEPCMSVARAAMGLSERRR